MKSLIRNKGVSGKKLREFRRIYEETGALSRAKDAVHADIRRAKDELDRLSPSSAREMLFWFADMLLNRTY